MGNIKGQLIIELLIVLLCFFSTLIVIQSFQISEVLSQNLNRIEMGVK